MDSLTRTRALVAERFWLVVAALVLATAVFGYLGYGTVVDPGSHTEPTVASSWTEEGVFSYGAVVRTRNPVFPLGSRLENRTVYYTNLSERLEGSFDYRYTASDGGSLQATTELRLVLASAGDDGETYWRVADPLARVNRTLEPGQSSSVGFDVNVSAVQQRIERIYTRLGARVGSPRARIVAVLETNGTVNGNAISQRRRYRLGISPGGSVYRVDDPGRVTNESQTRATLVVPNRPGLLAKALTGGGFVLSLAGLVALGVFRYTGRLTVDEATKARVSYSQEREAFEEWITPGAPPDDITDLTVVEVDSLEGLVDIAIDSDRRVIEDRSGGQYVVIDGNICYRYIPPRIGPAPDA